jgi:hypothetical protein
MGSLDAVMDRRPSLKVNDASVRLTALAKALPKNEVIDDAADQAVANTSVLSAKFAKAHHLADCCLIEAGP